MCPYLTAQYPQFVEAQALWSLPETMESVAPDRQIASHTMSFAVFFETVPRNR